ncbi:ribosomal protein S16 [Coprinopsis marcescibilis]|uniref:Ribosomal protein S16 n=1 Tax=Coprinopsis marcescibilis TaxID=230819 RepID=A0A5C3LCM2_COPMA|nr:ribosomal protein S16 [Coprinopsis marcescibilis]
MAVRLRMSVHGHRNYRIFHINVVPRGKKRDAKPTELLGVYDPHVPEGGDTKSIQWSVDRIRYWLSVGAQPSRPVLKLLELGGILKPGSPFHPKSQSGNHKSSLPSTKRSPILTAVEKSRAAAEAKSPAAST